MVKFLKPNKAVVMLNGRFAGRKGVIIKSFDDGTCDCPYAHCLVAGISKYPKKVIRKDSANKTTKKSRVKAFIKLINYKGYILSYAALRFRFLLRKWDFLIAWVQIHPPLVVTFNGKMNYILEAQLVQLIQAFCF